MPTGVVIHPRSDAANAVDDAVAQATAAQRAGVTQVWLAQRVDHDAIALAGLIGAAVPGLGVGTSVVPINPRHPLLISSAAQTAQAAAHGNFSLGLGLGAHEPERLAFGATWPDPVGRLREHLTVLRSLLDTGTVDFHGEAITSSPAWPATVAGGTAVPVYVAAMGPKALQVTGELADGTLPYLAGPRTIADFIVPTINRAAADAGRPRPRVIAMVPVFVTDDPGSVHEAVAAELGFYNEIPSYQKILARENVSGAADLAAVGPVESVLRQLRRYLDAGATDVALAPVGPVDDRAREALWSVAGSL
ncbi:TIGR03564 family F420-dependent LLM class oxidoreductase [Mycobacterium manitobense]|uniref:TIGR03564 family F420-dependent LLM class oxidoreductase n=1 Tax=[Mycobacterium] manitobense TaxID=190147 RepID=A0A9X3BY17_9MYCO|nr:TIGR03564 family F420-dependent LLM class oxidoreductase [[Mycobacterium] manitobense]MCV7171722.1 TIGR03564 family F420-dependent LLM class oxidoreductase [[Mycobacterium] manitobense]